MERGSENMTPVECRNSAALQNLRTRLYVHYRVSEDGTLHIAQQLERFQAKHVELLGPKAILGIDLITANQRPLIETIILRLTLPTEQDRTTEGQIESAFTEMRDSLRSLPVGIDLAYVEQSGYIQDIDVDPTRHHIGIMGSSGLRELGDWLRRGSRWAQENLGPGREAFNLVVAFSTASDQEQIQLVESIQELVRPART